MLDIILGLCVVVFFLGIFPEPDKDPVIQIANMVIRQGEKEPFIRNVFTLNTCAPIVGAEVLSNKREHDMIKVIYVLQFGTVCRLLCVSYLYAWIFFILTVNLTTFCNSILAEMGRFCERGGP